MNAKLVALFGVGAMAISIVSAVAIVKLTSDRDPRIDVLAAHIGELQIRIDKLEHDHDAARAFGSRP